MHKIFSKNLQNTKKLLLGASKAQYKLSSEGYILLTTLLFFSCGLLGFFCSITLLLHIRDRIAIKSKLDINTVQLVVGRKNFYETLSSSNKNLRMSGLAIIANTSMRPFSGPLGQLTLEVLKKIHQTIYLKQNFDWKKYLLQESRLKLCPSSTYSKTFCLCNLSPTLPLEPKRSPSPFPGVYGQIEYDETISQPHSALCKELYETTKIDFQYQKEWYKK